MKKMISTILVALSVSAVAPRVTAEIGVSKAAQKIVQKIRDVNVVEMSYNTEGGSPKEEENFNQLCKIATPNELMLLTDDSSRVVRCYAFRALTHVTSVNLFDVIIRHLADTQVVSIQNCDVIHNEPAADFYIDLITPQHSYPGRRVFTPAQMRALDSILVYTDDRLSARSKAMERFGPQDWLYPRVREMVIREHYGPAVIALAKYRKDQDTELIVHFRNESLRNRFGWIAPFEYTYPAIEQFPHPDFIPFLEAHIMETLDTGKRGLSSRGGLYSAVARYQNDVAARLLTIACTRTKDWELRSWNAAMVFEAVRQYLSPVYDSLLFELWDRNRLITQDVFEYLCKSDAPRALELAKMSLEHSLYIYYENDGHPELDATEKVIGAMLDYVLAQDRDSGMKEIQQNLGNSNVTLFPVFATAAKRIRDSSFVVPLLRQLSFQENAHIFLKAVDALLAYNDSTINREILTAVKEEKNLRHGWGGDSLKVLLRNRGLN